MRVCSGYVVVNSGDVYRIDRITPDGRIQVMARHRYGFRYSTLDPGTRLSDHSPADGSAHHIQLLHEFEEQG